MGCRSANWTSKEPITQLQEKNWTVFPLYLDEIMRNVLQGMKTGIRWSFTEKLEDSDFVDDIQAYQNHPYIGLQKPSNKQKQRKITNLKEDNVEESIQEGKHDRKLRKQKIVSIDSTLWMP